MARKPKPQVVAITVRVQVDHDGTSTWEDASLAYGTDRPYEVVIGYGNHPLWQAWPISLDVVILGVGSHDRTTGLGDVRVLRESESFVAIELRGGVGVAVVHFPAPAYVEFVTEAMSLFNPPKLPADEELAAQIEEWQSDVS